MSFKQISATLNLENASFPQPIAGFPDKYTILHWYFHSPSVNLGAVVQPQSDGIALQVSDSNGQSVYDDLYIQGGAPGIGLAEPDSGAHVNASQPNSPSNTTRVLQGDLSVMVNPPANAPATVQVEFVVLDLSE